MMRGILFILVFVIVFFSIIALLIGKFVYKAYKLFHQAKKAATDFNNMNGGEQNKGGFNARDYEGGAQQGNNDEETIIDTRDPALSKRKIFSPKEGEYVDYKEES